MKIGVRTKLIRTWRWAGRGRLTRRSNGPSRWRRISAARDRAWPFRGPAISAMSVASAPNFTTSLISCRPSLRPRASRRQSWSTAFRRNKLKEMQALFLTEAGKYQVFPLDNSGFVRVLAPKPSATAGKTEFTYTGVNAGIPFGNAPSILDKDYTITAEITVPKGGAEGMIVTLGGRFGGY